MNSRRDYRSHRAALFYGIEEGGIPSSLYTSHEIDEHENDRAFDGLQDRVDILKRLAGDINEEVESHNWLLDRMGNAMDTSRGVLSGTMDRFKMVFVTKSSRRMASLVASFLCGYSVDDPPGDDTLRLQLTSSEEKRKEKQRKKLSTGKHPA